MVAYYALDDGGNSGYLAIYGFRSSRRMRPELQRMLGVCIELVEPLT